jgi:hypothetical protein
LRTLPRGCGSYPAENDIAKYGRDPFFNNVDGDEKLLFEQTGFNIREALGDDTAWICKHADGIALLPNWDKSSGARAEYTLATALGLTTLVLGREFFK